MKKTIKFFMLFAVVTAMAFNLTSCKDEEVVIPEGDKTALNSLISECETILGDAVEGTSVGYYQVGSKVEFQTAVDAANAVSDLSLGAYQTVIDAAVANLTAAKTVFEGMQVQNVSTEGLVAQWLFNGDATDYTGNGFDGTVTTGHAFWGAGTATLTTDRFGNANSAYQFDKGGNIDVPYSTALNPASLSLSWWVYMEELPNNDYMISMNRWGCYKVNLQDINRVFFTAKAENPDVAGEFIYSDRDNNGDGLVAGQWYHLVVTFGGGHMIFYIDGVMVQDWDNVPNSSIVSIAGEPVDLVFGQDLPTAIYSTDDTSPYFVDWGGYFKGKLDDIRLYNRVLTSQEVSSIYILENF